MGKKDDNIIIIQGCPIWMLTLGDCISLLVTFFVMLLSFSTPNSDQLADALSGMKGALGVMNSGNAPNKAISITKSTASEGEEKGEAQDEGGKGSSLVSEDELAVVNLQNSKITNRYNEFKQRLLEIGFSNYVSAEQLTRGIVVNIPFNILYIENSAQLSPPGVKALESFANLAGSVGNEIQLVACFNLNTNNNEDAWKLARERTLAVGKMLREKYHINESRLTYGYEVIEKDQKPLMQMIIAEKMGVSRISIDELLNLSQSL